METSKFNPWIGVTATFLLSLSTLAYTFGIQAEKIRKLENELSDARINLSQTPAMVNELRNIDRRLTELKTSVDNLTARR